MIYDALDKFLFTSTSGIVATGDKVGAVITSTNKSDALDTVTGGVGLARPMVASIRYSAAANASGSNAVTFTVQKSTDNTNWYDFASGAAEVINLSTSAQAGVVNIRFNTVQEYIRIQAAVTGGGSTPTITIVSADLTYAAL